MTKISFILTLAGLTVITGCLSQKPEKVLDKSYDAMQQVSSAHYEVDMDLTMETEGESTTSHLTLDADAELPETKTNITALKESQLGGDVSASMSNQGVTIDIAAQFKLIDSALYIKIDEFFAQLILNKLCLTDSLPKKYLLNLFEKERQIKDIESFNILLSNLENDYYPAH